MFTSIRVILPAVVCGCLASGTWMPTVQGQQAGKLRVGVYDSRAIAVAYAPSDFNPVKQKMQEYQQAKKEGDTARAKQLEEWGQKHQRQLHRQGFGRLPVDDLLAHVQDQLAKVARDADVAVIVAQCDYTAADVEIVDVTRQLVALFQPSEKTLKTIEELKKHPPVDLDEIERHHDH